MVECSAALPFSRSLCGFHNRRKSRTVIESVAMSDSVNWSSPPWLEDIPSQVALMILPAIGCKAKIFGQPDLLLKMLHHLLQPNPLILLERRQRMAVLVRRSLIQ